MISNCYLNPNVLLQYVPVIQAEMLYFRVGSETEVRQDNPQDTA